jgi:hypothetical protein
VARQSTRELGARKMKAYGQAPLSCPPFIAASIELAALRKGGGVEMSVLLCRDGLLVAQQAAKERQSHSAVLTCSRHCSRPLHLTETGQRLRGPEY